jgi:hypothetical protein
MERPLKTDNNKLIVMESMQWLVQNGLTGIYGYVKRQIIFIS